MKLIKYGVSSYILLILLISVLWYWHRSPQKTKQNHIGFAVCLACENNEASNKLKEDFIIPLRRLITSGNMGGIFHFIELPQFIANKILDENDAKKLREVTRSHFMLHGRVRKRILDGASHHVIDLVGLVVHASLPKNIGDSFSREFSELLPRQLRISEENDYLKFQFTSEWADLVAKYIIGIAAAFSGDYDTAEKLYVDASVRLCNKDNNFPAYAILNQRLPIRISELYETRAIQSYNEWSRSHTPEAIENLGSHLQKIDNSRKNDPLILNLLAIYNFLKYRDTQTAISFLRKKNLLQQENISLHFNLAFLYCYKGDLKTATRHYRKAILTNTTPQVISEVEDFMCWILENECDKYQIYYALGFINWKVKGDYLKAIEDFRMFLDKYDGNSEFSIARDLVQGWILEIEKISPNTI